LPGRKQRECEEFIVASTAEFTKRGDNFICWFGRDKQRNGNGLSYGMNFSEQMNDFTETYDDKCLTPL